MKSNFLDKAIGALSPRAGFERMKARAATEQLETLLGELGGKRGYEGAGLGRRTEGWRTTPAGVNNENRPAMRLLRDRSRDLGRNNPYAKKAIQVFGSNVVGGGIKATSDLSAGKAKRLNKAWNRWADSPACDFDGQRNFYGIERAVMRAVAESGEALVLRKRLTPAEAKKYGRGYPLQVQVLEGDYLDSGRDYQLAEGGGRIIQGVEFDTNGRRVAYWLFSSHPGENVQWGDRTSKRIPAEDVLHIFEVLRPGQVRGIPFGVSAMLRLRDLDEYEDAQLIRQKIAACYAVIYSGAEFAGIGSEVPGTAAANQGTIPTHIEPGMIEKVPAGSTVTAVTPPPLVGYAEYVKAVLQAVAVGYGVTYEQLTGDYSNVNYSSARMARLEFGAYVSELQEMLIVQLCTPIWDWFVLAAFLVGETDEVGVGAKWTVPARAMVDPAKEVKAIKEAVRAGFMSWSDAVLSLGNVPEELRAAIVADMKEADKAKLKLTSDPRIFTDVGQPIDENAPATPTKETTPVK